MDRRSHHCFQKSLSSLGIWKKENTSQEGSYGIDLEPITKEKGKLDELLDHQPTLKEVVEVIDAPEQLLTFMNSYFSIAPHEGHTAYSPKKFLQLKEGNCKDWAVFAGYILKESGYKAKQLAYSPEAYKGGHVIAVYWLDDKIYYLTTKLTDAEIFGPFNNIKELLQNEVERSPSVDREITCYVLAPPTQLTVEKRCLFTD